MKTLEQVLEYTNSRVIDKFCEDYYFDKEEAVSIFRDTLMWLWLSASTEDAQLCAMYHPMLVMDKMWHTFLVFSKEYADFCSNTFGKFIHHEPHTRRDSVKKLTPTTADPNPFETISREIGSFQSHVYDVLGQEAVLRWFVTYPHIYSPEELQRRSRPQFSQRGFLEVLAMRSMNKESLMEELAKSHAIAAWCGGPGCGAYCRDPRA